jgi:hypothetical protein
MLRINRAAMPRRHGCHCRALPPKHQLFFASATLAPTPMSSVPLPTCV